MLGLHVFTLYLVNAITKIAHIITKNNASSKYGHIHALSMQPEQHPWIRPLHEGQRCGGPRCQLLCTCCSTRQFWWDSTTEDTDSTAATVLDVDDERSENSFEVSVWDTLDSALYDSDEGEVAVLPIALAPAPPRGQEQADTEATPARISASTTHELRPPRKNMRFRGI
jgi:hypothetical protein